ncbi:MAG: cytochrome c biogenesis CcdA family protein [Candidatus Limnocylindrales bacterium]
MAVQLLIAFAGGILSLLSPCSALLLPAFFAYAFPSPTRLALRTGIFYAGLITLLVPAGIGAGAIGAVLLVERGPLTLLAGVTLIAIGAVQLVLGGFELPGANLRPAMSAETAASTFVLGLSYGLGGFCAGPILGGILTIAAGSGGVVPGAVLLAAYGAGMAFPLFLLALVWERLGATWKGRLRGREIRVGGVERHLSTVLSSAMFILLGAGFIVFQGPAMFSGLYAGAGLDNLALQFEAELQSVAATAPLAVIGTAAGVALLLTVAGHWLLRAPAHHRDR